VADAVCPAACVFFGRWSAHDAIRRMRRVSRYLAKDGRAKKGRAGLCGSVCLFSSMSFGRGSAWQSSAATPFITELARSRKQNLRRFSHLTEKSSHELFVSVTIVIDHLLAAARSLRPL
jgi:hypothetical protein